MYIQTNTHKNNTNGDYETISLICARVHVCTRARTHTRARTVTVTHTHTHTQCRKNSTGFWKCLLYSLLIISVHFYLNYQTDQTEHARLFQWNVQAIQTHNTHAPNTNSCMHSHTHISVSRQMHETTKWWTHVRTHTHTHARTRARARARVRVSK